MALLQAFDDEEVGLDQHVLVSEDAMILTRDGRRRIESLAGWRRALMAKRRGRC